MGIERSTNFNGSSMKLSQITVYTTDSESTWLDLVTNGWALQNVGPNDGQIHLTVVN